MNRSIMRKEVELEIKNFPTKIVPDGFTGIFH